ncbi:LysR family transcriptional regulator [Phreatobacter sp. AB_2022a]|uniref:LysR family transcriptional regulator n=1 Tax=Phreatobacter sp. AB_2022a TaxID=3003134 RepID=UPI002286E2BD|nr:LysR family transcriptional regulator [Phreatobacter sp. AB_2022a]MCZ0733699.1 LysR family transcriptional regulator [Phreatobacter sp. AB_2022a]
MDLDDFRLLCAAVDRGGIAPAARECGLSPSMASRRIAALERTMGAKLLLRTTRSLAPTEAGEALLSWARSALVDWGRVRDEIGAMQGQAAGLVRLATNDYAASAYLPAILASFARRQPEIRVAISIAQEPARLLDGACDLAVHAGRRPDAELIGRRIYEYSRRLVAAPSYLASRPAPRTPAEVARHLCLTHTVSEPSEWTFEAADGTLHAQRIHSYMACDSWTMLLELAVAGIGIARLSDSLVRQPIAEGRLVELLPHMRSVYADGDPPAMWVLVAHRSVPLRTRLLADHIAQELLALHRSNRR